MFFREGGKHWWAVGHVPWRGTKPATFQCRRMTPMEPHQPGFTIEKKKGKEVFCLWTFLSSWGLKQQTWWGRWTYWGQQRTKVVKNSRTTLPCLEINPPSLPTTPKHPNVGYKWLPEMGKNGLETGLRGNPLLHFPMSKLSSSQGWHWAYYDGCLKYPYHILMSGFLFFKPKYFCNPQPVK